MEEDTMTTLKRQLKAVKEPQSAQDLAKAIFRDADRKLAKKTGTPSKGQGRS